MTRQKAKPLRTVVTELLVEMGMRPERLPMWQGHNPFDACDYVLVPWGSGLSGTALSTLVFGALDRQIECAIEADRNQQVLLVFSQREPSCIRPSLRQALEAYRAAHPPVDGDETDEEYLRRLIIEHLEPPDGWEPGFRGDAGELGGAIIAAGAILAEWIAQQFPDGADAQDEAERLSWQPEQDR